jgi:serine protease Do
VITSINGNPIKTSPELQEQVGRYRPGDKIDVTVVRDGKEKVYAVTLRNKDGNTKVIRNESISLLGATLSPLSESDLEKLKISKGIKVKDLSAGKLKSAGIKEGFIITSIDNQPVGNVEDLTDYLENKKGGVLIEGIYPNGMRAYYGFGM